MRTVLATFLAPLAAAVTLGVINVLSPSIGGGFSEVTASAVATYAIILVLTAMVAVPTWIFARRYYFARLWVAALVGASVGCIAFGAAVEVLSRIPRAELGVVPLGPYLKCAVVGAVCGCVFWFVARRELRPNTSLERTRER